MKYHTDRRVNPSELVATKSGRIDSFPIGSHVMCGKTRHKGLYTIISPGPIVKVIPMGKGLDEAEEIGGWIEAIRYRKPKVDDLPLFNQGGLFDEV